MADVEIGDRPLIFEPVRGSSAGPELLALPGLDRVRRMVSGIADGSIPAPPFTRFTGLAPTEGGLGMAAFAMPASPWWQSAAGVFPAGALAFVADGPVGGAVLTSVPAYHAVITTHLSIDFVRPATIRSGSIIGRGRLIHSTATQGLAELSIEDAKGRILAHGTSRCMIIKIDPARLPPAVESAPEEPTPDPYLRPVSGEILDQKFFNETPGSEIVQSLKAGQWRSPSRRFFGLEAVEADEDLATVTMPASRWLATSSGNLYGGSIAFLADSATNLAVATKLPPATAFAPIDLKVNFLRPVVASEGRLSARSTVIHRGRSLAVTSCEIRGPDSKIVAIANESVLILPGRSWDRPVRVGDEHLQPAASPGE